MELFKDRATLERQAEEFRRTQEAQRPEAAAEFEQAAEPQKLQRDMSPEELDAFRDKLMADMQAKLNEQYQVKHQGHDERGAMIERVQDQEPANDYENEDDKLKRDMDEAELEAARQQIGERLAEAAHGFEDGSIQRGRDDDPELER